MSTRAANQLTPLADPPDGVVPPHLLAGAQRAALATFAGPGAPVGSLITLVSRGGVALCFSLHEGSEHAQNLARDARATVIVGDGDSSRVTLSGRAHRAGQDARGNLLYRLEPEAVRVSVHGSDSVKVQLPG